MTIQHRIEEAVLCVSWIPLLDPVETFVHYKKSNPENLSSPSLYTMHCLVHKYQR